MTKTLIAVTGVAVFMTSFILNNNFRKGERNALSLDKKETKYGSIGEGPLPCAWEVKPPERIISEDKSQAVVLSIMNQSDTECESIVSLRAPGFDYSPVKEEQRIMLKEKAKGSLSWILTPRKTGTYEIAVSDILNTRIFGITVTNTLGLSTVQAKVASVLGTLFGPMLTVPWWWEKLRKNKEGQKSNP